MESYESDGFQRYIKSTSEWLEDHVRSEKAKQDRYLLRSGRLPLFNSSNGEAGLHAVTDAEHVGHWLSEGAPINGLQRTTSYSDGIIHFDSPLIAALVSDRLDVARELIARGASVDAPFFVIEPIMNSMIIHTPLQMVVSRQNRPAIDLLLGFLADVNKRSSFGTTALSIAAKKDDLVGVERLLQAGAVIDVLDFTGRHLLDEAGPEARSLLESRIPR